MGNAKKERGMTRREFLKASGAVAGGVAVGSTAPGLLTGCATGATGGRDETKTAASVPKDIVETVDTDIVVVGAGISGLACAVQAAQNGNRVLVLEKGDFVGGNGIGTEGIFAVNSAIQQRLGIHINSVDIVAKELEEAQYRVDGSLWIDLINKSADNIAWLQENGVQFSGVVDNYHTGLFQTMHWFRDSSAAAAYIPPMQAAAENRGARFRMNTQADMLIKNNGTISGLYALNSDGKHIKIDARAVVLATGGIGANKDLLVKEGWEKSKVEEMMIQSVATVKGDGYNMAMAAGAKDHLTNGADLFFNAIRAFGFDSVPPYDSPLNASLGPASGGPVLWVNQDADRFNNEGIAWYNMSAQATACKGNRETYTVFDQAVLNTYTTDPVDAEIVSKAFTAANEDSIFRANDFESLARHFGLDVQNFVQTVNRYNDLCKSGRDLDFGKSPQFLKALTTPPYYMAKLINLLVVIVGAITTNKRAEVLDGELKPIPGLYAAGVDGAMLWRNVYMQNMPGSCMGNNVNSGRNAARSAAAFIKG
ncbi:MAG: FAD-dependent oxidoreductase [Spirochaetaceae bacterium]|jgi:fumarate reductase flavoprotein subunit|nr:FAD-dependent oxidoreductase [Spirochaetaceae bacterium]